MVSGTIIIIIIIIIIIVVIVCPEALNARSLAALETGTTKDLAGQNSQFRIRITVWNWGDLLPKTWIKLVAIYSQTQVKLSTNWHEWNEGARKRNEYEMKQQSLLSTGALSPEISVLR